MQKQHLVTLTPEQRVRLDRLAHHRKTDPLTKRHARILLLCDTTVDGGKRTDVGVGQEVGCTARQVARLRSHFVTEGFERALYRKQPRVTTPRKLDATQEARIIELAVQPAPTGHVRWSLTLLQREAMAQGIVDRLCRETIRQTLKRGGVRSMSSAPG